MCEGFLLLKRLSKRRTANVNLYHVTKFPLYSLFTIHYKKTKIGGFTPMLSIRIVFICSFLILKISHLESQVCPLP